MDKAGPDVTERVMDLAKRRGFLWPSFDVYGGAAGFYDYGPLGAVMKRRFEDLWRKHFVQDETTPMAEISCPRLTPEPVLVASGHVGEFTDLLVTCLACNQPLRADHLVAAAGFAGNAGALSAADVDKELAARKPKCPQCGKTGGYSASRRQNLMNQTEIGPGSGRVGYLRPETAQGIFTDYPLLLRHFRDKIPFGVVQVGGSNRNEISPRQGMLRLREFHMMEAEVFYDPMQKVHREFASLADNLALFVPNKDETPRRMSFRDAVQEGWVANEALAYWLAKTQLFLLDAGMHPERLRFRQHLANEMAHYAADCWDAEFHSDRYGWVECVGVADRGDYDLRQHAHHSGTDEKDASGAVQRRLNAEFLRFVPPQAPVSWTTRMIVPSRKFFPLLKKDARAVQERLVEESPYAIEAHAKGFDGPWTTRQERYVITEAETGRTPIASPKTVVVEGRPVDVPAEALEEATLEVTVQGRRTLPCVIEPSFGVDRILYALWEHAYEAGEKNGEAYVRLRLSARVAPVQVALLPLTGKDGLPELARGIERDLRRAGFLTDLDESGSIGRRYARQDEVGTPCCVTVDNESLRDASVTVRARDTTEQVRVPLARLAEHIRVTLEA